MHQHIIQNDELDWLARLPEFEETSRPRIRERLEDQLREWQGGYAHDLAPHDHDTPSLRESPLLEESLRRMWDGWRYHWQGVVDLSRRRGQVLAAGGQVAESLRAGRRPTNDQLLGGDPLRDCVLTTGVLHGHGGSVAHLQEVGREILGEQMRRWKQPLDEALLQDFLIQLGGFDSPRQSRARLRKFSGFTSLRVWLRRVARNFLIDAFRSRRTRLEREMASRRVELGNEPGTLEATVEYVLSFPEAARAALASLGPRQQLALYLKWKQQLPNKQIARLLAVTPPRSSQICQAAQQAFGEKFCRLAGIDPTSAELSSVLDTSSALLAYVLLDEIGRAAPRNTNPGSDDMSREPAKRKGKKKTRQSKDAATAGPRGGTKSKRSAAKRRDLSDEQLRITGPPEEDLSEADLAAGRIASVPEAFISGRNVARQPFDREDEDYDTPQFERRLPGQIPPEEDEEALWRELLPVPENELAGVTLQDNPEELFAAEFGRTAKQRPAILCLDARRASFDATREWIRRFLDNLDAQPDQPPNQRYEPALAIVTCEMWDFDFSDSSEWLDFPMVITDDLQRTAVEIYRDDLLTGIRSIVAPPLTEDERLPEGYRAVDASEILSDDEMDELRERDRASRAIRRRFRQL